MNKIKKKKHKRHPQDYYPTNKEAIEPLLDLICFDDLVDEGWKFAEPCKGIAEGIYQYFPWNSEYAELSEGIDYLTHRWESRVNCIITNPPFSLAQEFLDKSLEEADVVIYLLRLGFLESINRKEFNTNNPPDHLVVLSKRPSFTGNGKTDSAAYAWFIYDKENKLGLQHPFYFI